MRDVVGALCKRFDWLTDLEAALPSLSYIIQHPERPTVAWFRRLKSISDSTSDTDIQSDYDTFVTTWFDQDRILYGHVLGHVSWRKDSNLKRVIHGHGVEENGASALLEGHKIIAYLRQKSGKGLKATKFLVKDRASDWHAIESVARRPDVDTATPLVFTDLSSMEPIIQRLGDISDIYESIPAFRSHPSWMFVEPLLVIIRNEVEPMRHWANNKLSEFAGNEDSCPSRADFVALAIAQAEALCHRATTGPSFAAAIPAKLHAAGSFRVAQGDCSSECCDHDATLNAAFGRRNTPMRTGNKAAPKFTPGGPKRLGTCPYCPARGCNATKSATQSRNAHYLVTASPSQMRPTTT